MVCENRRNDSNLSETGSRNQVTIIYLPQDLEPPHLTQGADLTTSAWECIWFLQATEPAVGFFVDDLPFAPIEMA